MFIGCLAVSRVRRNRVCRASGVMLDLPCETDLMEEFQQLSGRFRVGVRTPVHFVQQFGTIQ